MVQAPSGQVTALFLFDVAGEIRLADARAQLGLGSGNLTAMRHPSVPPYVRYADPPIQTDATSLGLSLEGHPDLGLRVRLYDYGVISLALTRTCAGSFPALQATAREAASGMLEALALDLCRQCVERLAPALVDPRPSQLTEDYVVSALVHDGGGVSAASLLTEHGTDIARLLRLEAADLSAQERDEVLQHRLSYLANDLVIPSWSGAFVYDTAAGVDGALELLEFANSQLLQFRYYDQRLEADLRRIYARLQKRTRWYDSLIGRRYTAAARELHALFIDVNELIDRTENALKLVGDVYAARLLGLASARLGLDAWKHAVREQLDTLDRIYRFAVDQTSMDRGELLELTVVLILLLELVLFFLGVMR
jgi:hypothetical protein